MTKHDFICLVTGWPWTSQHMFQMFSQDVVLHRRAMACDFDIPTQADWDWHTAQEAAKETTVTVSAGISALDEWRDTWGLRDPRTGRWWPSIR